MKKLLYSLLLLVAAGSVSAADLVRYDFADPTASDVTFVAPGLGASSMSISVWAFSGTDVGGYQNNAFVRMSTAAVTNSLAEAINTDTYLQFDVSNSSGSAATLDSLSFTLSGQANNASADEYTFDVAGFLDLSGFGAAPTAGSEFGSDSITTTGQVGTDANNKLVTLNIGAFNLADGATASFRVYGWNSFNQDGLQESFEIVRVTGFALTGTVVPEPSTFALAGLGIAGLLIFRRRS